MLRRVSLATVVALGLPLASGCGGSSELLTGDAGLAPLVATKAVAVAEQIGGVNGFGGTMMNRYADHAPRYMGFVYADDLAAQDEPVNVLLHNDSGSEATFHLTYVASYLGLEEQIQDVVVPAGDEATVAIPCAEIIGLGPLEIPGAMGCHLNTDGQEIDNLAAVPVFLGMDYLCGDTVEFRLTADVDDVDRDGDTEELIALSDGLLGHMRNGGPMGHTHRMGMMGMMFGHMGEN